MAFTPNTSSYLSMPVILKMWFTGGPCRIYNGLCVVDWLIEVKNKKQKNNYN